MKIHILLIFVSLTIACEKNNVTHLDDLNSIKSEFLSTIFDGELDEAPFFLSYKLKTVFFSKDVISVFGELSKYTNLPHENTRYEGKTFCRINGRFKEIFFDDLFSTVEQKEFIRNYCENSLKEHSVGYFGENPPFREKLGLEDIQTFVIDDQFLIIIFQRYVVAGLDDLPTTLKIPFSSVRSHLNPHNVLMTLLDKAIISNSFISSWIE
jgi:hypothetical protein